MQIGRNVSIGSRAKFERGVSIASNVRIGADVLIKKYACVEKNTTIPLGYVIAENARIFPMKGDKNDVDFQFPRDGYEFILKNDTCKEVKL